MKSRFYLVGLAILLTKVSPLISQDIRFEKMILPKLPDSNHILGITQDLRGNIWIGGSSGLFQYDGFRYKTFTNDIADSGSLALNKVEAVYADKSGNIWAGTFGKGLDKYDQETVFFTHYQHNEKDPASISCDTITCITQDHEGFLWVGTLNGLNRMDIKTGKFTHYRHQENDPTSLMHDWIRSLYVDKKGVIWVGAGGLNRFNASTGTFTHYLHDENNPRSLIDNQVRTMFEDSRGYFWVGTAGDGLHTMDRTTGTFERHTYDPLNPEKLSRPPVKKLYTWADDIITFITEDSKGALWIGTFENGIMRYDPATKKKTHFTSQIDSNGNSSSWWGFISRDGVIWVSTWGAEGLYRFDPAHQNILHTNAFNNNRVESLLELPDRFQYFSTKAGLVQVNKKNNHVQLFACDPKTKGSISSPGCYALYKDSKNRIWVSPWTGNESLDLFNPDLQSFTQYKLNPKVPTRLRAPEETICVYEDRQSNFWVGTNRGLEKMSIGKGLFTRDTLYKIFDEDTLYFGKNTVSWIKEDRNQNLWVGTVGGALILDRKTGMWKHYLNNHHAMSMLEDSNGKLWVVIANGLYYYNDKTDNFILTNPAMGDSFSWPAAMVEDNDKNIWISSPTGLFRFNIARNEITKFGKDFGIDPASISGITLQKSKDGQLLIGNNNGYYSLYPEKISGNENPPEIVLTEFKIGYRPIREDLLHAKQIELSYDQDGFSLLFKVFHYSNPEENKAMYRLDNYEKDWHGSDVIATYSSVPPGNYVLHIKAVSSEGVWAEKLVNIIVSPPWWTTRWAYSLLGLSFIAFLWIARRSIIQRERSKSKLQLDRMELEKALEVDRAKSSFFTNVSHEFRTPLTLIKGPAESLAEEFADSPVVAGKLLAIGENADQLLKLVNQVLDLARLESGKVKIEMSEGNLTALIQRIAESFSSHASLRGISYSIQSPLQNWIANFDEGKTEVILTNLIANALKFTPGGGSVQVKADVEKNWNSEDHLVITVSDTGIGISKDELAHIFERFYQVNSSHKESGTGIGLSLVKDLAELLGGKVTVNSEPGKGSEFRVDFPVKILRIDPPVRKDTEKILPAPLKSKVEFGTKTSDRPRVLVVEDSRELLLYIISSLGEQYDFLEAENGKSGLEMATKEIPEIIISDVMMPEMDGMEMTRAIKSDMRTSHIPVILLTARASEADKLSGLEVGADDYLTKPFNKNEVVLKVKNILARQSRTREIVRKEIENSSAPPGIPSVDEQFLAKVKSVILKRVSDEQLSVESLAEEIGISRVQLYRKLSALTGMSVIELIREYRLQYAAKLLEKGFTVSQVAFDIGFSNHSHFSRLFRDKYGMFPSEYPRKRG